MVKDNRESGRNERRHLSLKMKITLSLSAIAVTLLVSSIISVMEYHRMSTYVSSLISDNVKSIDFGQNLVEAADRYNLDILTVIGDDSLTELPDFDGELFMAQCDSLRESLSSNSLMPLADSVVYSYSAYMLTSLELPQVLLSDFIDSRTWYFERLQPRYNRLRLDIDALNKVIYNDLERNSSNFDKGFYRSIIPGIVAVGVGLLLILMLLFFMLVYYVNPIYKMLSALANYRSYNKKYNYSFDGDDQLAELNDGIAEMAAENMQLHKRLTSLRASLKDANKL